MDELTREFLIESQEGLDRMERCLTDLEERPEDKELLGEIFRAVHTIKGTTGFLGFKRLEKLAHAGENLLGLLRDGKLAANQPIITGLLQLLDGLRAILKTIEHENQEGDAEDTGLIGLMQQLQLPATAAVAKPVGFKAEMGAVADIASPVQSLQPAAPPTLPTLLELGTAPPLLKKAELIPARTPALAPEPESPKEEAVPTAKPKAAAATESTLRVDVVLLNRMMNLVGELVLTRNQILQATAQYPNLTLLSRRLDMVTADLRESVMRARMQPVSNVFSKFPRIIRDLSQLLNRKVRLVLEGQETELDKSLLEAIKDPLTHAVRNSLDHGIEPPEKRVAAGKDPEGTLRLRAYQESSHVVIEVSDDGAGIGVERVRAKAIERGLITAERASQLGERELLQLIFLPGFSTAEAVTNVSGRGVGMDVVRTNVEKIGGKVEIESRPGNGTTLRLRIPLTLAIIPALIVRSLGQSFALPQGVLSELVLVPADQAASAIEWIEGASLYRLRGQLLPLIFLDRMLAPFSNPSTSLNTLASSGISANETNRSQPRDHYIAVLDADGRRFGLVVDGLADPEEIVVKPVSAVLKSIGLYTGATILGSGDLALILDPSAIASRAGVSIRAGAHSGEAAQVENETETTAPQFLLVETGDRRAAIPLRDVLRIENVPLARIEYLGSSPVLNFDGELLPIDDPGGAIQLAALKPVPQVKIVVCRDGQRQIGIAVTHVLDVSAGADLFESGSDRASNAVTLVNQLVTSILSPNGTQPPLLGNDLYLPVESDCNSREEVIA